MSIFLELLTFFPAFPIDENLPTPVNRQIDFVRDVAPIFQKACNMCHGDDMQANGYSLSRQILGVAPALDSPPGGSRK